MRSASAAPSAERPGHWKRRILLPRYQAACRNRNAVTGGRNHRSPSPAGCAPALRAASMYRMACCRTSATCAGASGLGASLDSAAVPLAQGAGLKHALGESDDYVLCFTTGDAGLQRDFRVIGKMTGSPESAPRRQTRGRLRLPPFLIDGFSIDADLVRRNTRCRESRPGLTCRPVPQGIL